VRRLEACLIAALTFCLCPADDALAQDLISPLGESAAPS